MVTARRPRQKTRPAITSGRAPTRRGGAKPSDTIQRKIDKIIKRRAAALRALD